MTAAVALPRPFDLTVDALHVVGDVSFNDWRRAGEQLFAAESSVMWYLGDWWLAGVERFGGEYRDALDAVQRRRDTVVRYARVCRAFPPRSESRSLRSDTYPDLDVHRISEVGWRHHAALAAVVDDAERMAWLQDVVRQNWTEQQLLEELARTARRVSRPSPLTLRPEGELRVRVEANAAQAGVPPRDYALIALELAMREPRVLKAITKTIQAQRTLEAA